MDFLNSVKCDEAFNEVENYAIEEVHIWLRQRTTRKYITDVQGLASDLNLNKIMKYWRHEFHCSVTKTLNKNKEKIIRLQGDKRDQVDHFLINEKIIAKEHIKIHGF